MQKPGEYLDVLPKMGTGNSDDSAIGSEQDLSQRWDLQRALSERMRVSTLQILLLADSQVLLFFLTHGMESEFPVPIFGIRLTKTSLSLPACV